MPTFECPWVGDGQEILQVAEETVTFRLHFLGSSLLPSRLENALLAISSRRDGETTVKGIEVSVLSPS